MFAPDYASAILASDLERKQELTQLVRPTIYAVSCPDLGDPAVGASRLGGRPDLPSGAAWPVFRGMPLSFIGQINLAELPDMSDRHLLPVIGFLYFFYAGAYDDYVDGSEPDASDAFRVIYSDANPQQLQTVDFPAGLEQANQDYRCVYDPVHLKFAIGNTFPDGEHPALERLGYSYLTAGFAAHERLSDVLQTAEKTGGTLPDPLNQLLGYPDPIQTAVCFDAEVDSTGFRYGMDQNDPAEKERRRQLDERAVQWELLLQVDTQDDLNGMIWGDCGRLYYMIRREDLVARRWNAAWMVMQCT